MVKHTDLRIIKAQTTGWAILAPSLEQGDDILAAYASTEDMLRGLAEFLGEVKPYKNQDVGGYQSFLQDQEAQ